MKKGILFTTVVLLSAVGFAQAQEGELHGYIDLTWQSKYIWRGFDVYADKSAIQPSLNLDLYGTGFGVDIAMHRANSSGFENSERWDYTIFYRNAVCKDETYATNYMIGYRYYNYPDNSSHTRSSIDLQEFHMVFSWPNILPVKGLVPTYCLVKLWPSNSGTIVGSRSPSGGTASGWAHIFMLDYPLTVPGFLPETPEQVLNLHSELVYNDGVAPDGGGARGPADHDWSNAVLGVSTDFELSKNFVFTPGLFYQVTMDSSVNDDKDETWLTLGFKYKF
ncbi:MAG TPA: hypothetical protein VMW16_14420 [Sedimentisphaerales bacterium]|nr:hypothetical protein [Sedimentisphaerales bacterium]